MIAVSAFDAENVTEPLAPVSTAVAPSPPNDDVIAMMGTRSATVAGNPEGCHVCPTISMG